MLGPERRLDQSDAEDTSYLTYSLCLCRGRKASAMPETKWWNADTVAVVTGGESSFPDTLQLAATHGQPYDLG